MVAAGPGTQHHLPSCIDIPLSVVKRPFLSSTAALVSLAFVTASLNGQTAPPSASAQKIAFHSGNAGTSQIYIMNADGSGRTKLTDDSASNVAPEISPDGTQIVFVSDRDGTGHIYLMDIDGRGQHRITDSPGAEGEPTWSPTAS